MVLKIIIVYIFVGFICASGIKAGFFEDMFDYRKCVILSILYGLLWPVSLPITVLVLIIDMLVTLVLDVWEKY